MPQPQFSPITATKTFTVTKTKLLVATAALAAASGLAMMFAPPGMWDDYGDYGPPDNASAPGAPVVTALPDAKVSIAIGADENTAETDYAIREEITRQFVQGDGTLSASQDPYNPYAAAYYQTKEEWGTVTVLHLEPDTDYEFDVDAKRSNDVHSGWGPITKVHTTTKNSNANTPTAPIVKNGPLYSELTVAIGEGDNSPPTTRYTIQMNGGYVQPNGSVKSGAYVNAVYQTKEEWGTTVVKGLKADTEYSFNAAIRRNDGSEAWGPLTQHTTAAEPACRKLTAEVPPLPDGAKGQDPTELLIKVLPSPNAFTYNNTPDPSCWTRYAIFVENMQKYVGPQGELENSPTFLTDTEWGTKRVIKLKPGTKYEFKVLAKNTNDIAVESVGAVPYSTSLYPPHKPIISDIASSTAKVSWQVSEENPPSVQYAISLLYDNGPDRIPAGYVQSDGSIGEPLYRTTLAGWGNDKVTFKLLPGYSYQLYVFQFYDDGTWGPSSPEVRFNNYNKN
jgi:hypothetical protein